MPEDEVLAAPGRPLSATMTLRWEPEAGAPRARAVGCRGRESAAAQRFARRADQMDERTAANATAA